MAIFRVIKETILMEEEERLFSCVLEEFRLFGIKYKVLEHYSDKLEDIEKHRKLVSTLGMDKIGFKQIKKPKKKND